MSSPVLNFTAVDLAIAKLDLAPADILVVKVAMRLDEETRRRIHESLKLMRPDGGKVMVLDDMFDVSVVKAVQS
jgi:hypothetical protein